MPHLSNLTLPEGLTEIGPAAMMSCTSLGDIRIPDGVTHIGSLAFSRSSLRRITLGAAVDSLGKDIFTHCRELRSIEVDAANKAFTMIDGALFTADRSRLIKRPPKPEVNPTLLTLPPELRHIDPYACEGSTTMRMPSFPEGLESIGEYVFAWCPAMGGTLRLPSTLKAIGAGAFFGAGGVRAALCRFPKG